MAGVYLFPAALIADIVDDEASHYAPRDLVEKAVTSVAPLLLTSLLALGSTADDPLGVRLVGPAAGALIAVALWCFRGYRLPDDPLPAAAR